MLKRFLRRFGKHLCLAAVVIGGLSMNGCFFIGGHGHHHHHDCDDGWDGGWERHHHDGYYDGW